VPLEVDPAERPVTGRTDQVVQLFRRGGVTERRRHLGQPAQPGALVPAAGCQPAYSRAQAGARYTTPRGTGLRLPMAQAEGRYPAGDGTLEGLEGEGLVALRYVGPDGRLDPGTTVNGSKHEIAGVYSRDRNVMGLMPHPERASEAILGNADLLAILSPPESDERRAAEAIIIGAQRAADLVSKMLAYSGGGRVVAQHVDLDALVKEMVDLLGASVARHCTLIYNSPGPLPLVETDPTQIRQVVLNLIVNATEAVEAHGVVTVETGGEVLDRSLLKLMTCGSDVRAGG